MPILDGRTAAVRAVTNVLSGRGFVADVLRGARQAGQLDSREAALAMEIGLGTVRHLITIEHAIGALARFDREHTLPLLRAVLYTAVYQVIWMSRIPLSAAVDQAVGLARAQAGGGASGMVNAILRRVTEAVVNRAVAWVRLDPTQVRTGWDSACQFGRQVLPNPADQIDAHTHVAAATGERSTRYRTLCNRLGPRSAEQVAWASQALPPVVLQRNVIRCTPEEFTDSIHRSFGEGVHAAGDSAVLPPGVAFGDSLLFRAGDAYVQDMTAHLAANAVRATPGERVLDLCAAPGGKSVALALAMRDHGEVVACDNAADRLKKVDENARRLGLTCIRCAASVSGSGLDECPLFDAALVDVPCSNSGVIARRPESRLGLTDAKIRSLAELQRELLWSAARRVRSGGRLVYSTCSIEPEENGSIVAGFVAAHTEWRVEDERTTLPVWGGCWSDWRDGGYYACLVRGAGG